ncbi:serine/threonine protein kinase, CMGC, CDC2/CDK sub [Sporothrix epigloea]|uniref:cyclin-dependent kinase n=1 Tax=Sporothrix epigloea TaxID=1892477 RepID=A0ABP0D5C2_9PEZI
MATRSGSYRIGAGHGPQGNGEDSTQQQYHQTQHTQHDPPRYSRQQQHSHSHHPPQSEHATPNTSYQGSQSYQSPYGGSQGWDTGHQQYSPQGQYSQQAQNPPYSNRSPIGTPHGPAAYHQANSPPYGAPLGPGGQYGNLRGSQHGPGRGGHRHSAGNGANGSYHGQDASLEGDHRASPMSVSPQMGSHQHNRNNRHGSHHPPHSQGPNSYTQSSERYSDKQRQHAADDGQSLRSERGRQESRHSAADDQMLPPSKRQPPTGPQSKFSFAFKNVSKPLVAVPKTEIAQKLSSVVQSQQQQQQQQDALPPPAQPSEIAKSGFPVGAPTEPASIRARSEQQRQRAEASSQQMRGGAYYHKVKQIVRRPKARPTLPDDFAASESVYYRKPGNESVVGAGTYGKVFKAVHVYTKRLVALKRIRMDGEREGLPVTAIREIKLLQSLRHSNVVDLLEVMVEGNNCFMVFEYLSHDLNGLLNHPTFKMNAAQKKHMALQLFQGLDYLHRRGVLHRDIKAANILVSNTGVLKLADFGLARFFAKHHKLDYSNRVVTIWYRSPELLLGETRYGPAVDIWSAACVLGEIFTHKPVFPCNGGEIGQINKIYSILGTPSKHDWPELTDMPWFELLRPEMKMPNVFAEKYQKVLSPAAFDVLRSMFHYDPAKRPTAEQVLEHPYFTQEEPAPRQAVELAEIGGEWHEFESKALRRQTENAKKAGDARKTILPATSVAAGNEPIETGREDKKRPAGVETDRAKTDVAVQRDAKRQHTETLQDRPQSPPPASARAASSVVSTMTDAAVAKIDTAQKGDKAAATEVAAISPPPPPEPELGQPVHLTGTVQQ